MIKIFNIDEGNLHIFRMTQGILMKFAGKMSLEIVLKVTKIQGFTLSLQNAVLKKPQGVQIDLPISLFREKKRKVPPV